MFEERALNFLLEKIPETYHPNIISLIIYAGFFSIIGSFLWALWKIFCSFGLLKDYSVKGKIFLAEHFEYEKFKKDAISSDIENIVNNTILKVRKEFPEQWISGLSIKWVKEAHDISTKKDLIVRMRPFENQDTNIINGIDLFLRKLLFPNNKDILPKTIKNAVRLHLSRRIIAEYKQYLLPKFESDFLEPSVIENPTIASYLGKYKKIDEKGFWSSIFIRESDAFLKKARFSNLRLRSEDEIQVIADKLGSIVDKMQDYREIPDEDWYYETEGNSYSFILVAHPYNIGSNTYVDKAKKCDIKKIGHLYILGNKEEVSLTKRIIKLISREIPNYRLESVFDLYKDYRGERGGMGALFIHRHHSQIEENIIESFERE